MKTYKAFSIITIFIGSILLTSCEEDYLETSPTDLYTANIVFQTTEGAETVLNGIYRWLYSWNTEGTYGYHIDFGQKATDLALDMMYEDIVMHAFHWFGYFHSYSQYALTQDYSRPRMFWNFYYDIINNANIILQNIDATSGNKGLKDRLKGEALALRGYAYFYLSQIFCKTFMGNESAPGVPVYTEPTTLGNPRGTIQQVYDRIVEDLDNSIDILKDAEDRPTKSNLDVDVVRGIRARVALVMNDWNIARDMARDARAGYVVMNKDDYVGGFNDVSNESWMWGLDINPEQATVYASFFSHMAPNIDGYAGGLGIYKRISKRLYDTISAMDIRKFAYLSYDQGVSVPGSQYKFLDNGMADWTNDYVLMRTAEMVLIEAEAEARMGNDAEARTLLNVLRAQRYLDPPLDSPNSGEALIEEILLERRIELWGEGFSWLDMKRTKKGLNRGPSHEVSVCRIYIIPPESDAYQFQIPVSELESNENIGELDQNPNPVPNP
jgi:hypothetical protein